MVVAGAQFGASSRADTPVLPAAGISGAVSGASGTGVPEAWEGRTMGLPLCLDPAALSETGPRVLAAPRECTTRCQLFGFGSLIFPP